MVIVDRDSGNSKAHSFLFSRMRLAQEGPLQSHMATDSSVEVHVSDEIVHECCTDPDVVDAS